MSNQEKLTTLTGLLDFYSDRATAHASFVVAGTFGIYTLLFSYNLFRRYMASRVVFFLACLALIAVNIYSFLNFGYYATLADYTKTELEGEHHEEYRDKLKEKLRKRNTLLYLFLVSKSRMRGQIRYSVFSGVFFFAVILPFIWLFFFS